jgi:hypothetical protein
MKKTITHHAKSKRYKVKRWKQNHKVGRKNYGYLTPSQKKQKGYLKLADTEKGKKHGFFVYPREPEVIYIGSNLKDLDLSTPGIVDSNIESISRGIGHERLHSLLMTDISERASLGLDLRTVPSIQIKGKKGGVLISYEPQSLSIFPTMKGVEELHKKGLQLVKKDSHKHTIKADEKLEKIKKLQKKIIKMGAPELNEGAASS